MALLENERIRLRALEPEDLEVLYRWENDSALWECGSTLAPFSRYILKEYIANSHPDLYESRQLRMMIESRAGGEPVGLVDLFDFEPRHNRAACGILIDREHQAQGYATEAMRLMMAYAFSFLGLHQLYAHVSSANEPSRRLFAGCGFTEVGLLKDWVAIREGYADVWIVQAIRD